MTAHIKIEKNLVYGKTEKELLTADVYLPEGGENLPVVLLIHGGSWQSGAKEMYTEWGVYLAQHGFAAIAINYRLASRTYATWPGLLEDMHMAIQWIISKANEWKLEPQNIALIGDSSGAHIAALFALTATSTASFSIRSVIAVYGGYDLIKRRENLLGLGPDNPVEKMMGCTPEEDPEAYRKASPILLIDEALLSPTFNTSFFLIWGAADKLVPPSLSEEFASKLEEVGLTVQTLAIPEYGHFWFNVVPGLEGGRLQDYPNTLVAPQVVDFLKKELLDTPLGSFSAREMARIRSVL